MLTHVCACVFGTGTGFCVDMCIAVYVGMYACHMYRCPHVCTDKHVDMCIGMCAEMCMGMHVDGLGDGK